MIEGARDSYVSFSCVILSFATTIGRQSLCKKQLDRGHVILNAVKYLVSLYEARSFAGAQDDVYRTCYLVAYCVFEKGRRARH